MPRLPDATSLSQVRTNSVMPVATYRGNPVAEAVQGFGNAVQSVGANVFTESIRERDLVNRQRNRMVDETIQGHEAMEDARAKSYILQKSIDLQNQFDADPDYGTFQQRYAEGMRTAMDDASKLIGSPQRQQMFRASVLDDVVRGQAVVQQKSRARAADSTLALMQENIRNNNAAALATRDPVMQQRFLEENGALIDGMHRQFPDMFKATDAFKAAQDAAVNGFALPAFSMRRPEDQLNLITSKLGFNVTDKATANVKESKPLPIKIREGIEANAARRGLDPDFMARVLHIENAKMDPQAVSSTGVFGLAQITKAKAREYNVNRSDPDDNLRGMADILADERDALQESLGRPPTDGEVYLAYQQGGGGARALLNNPDANAIDALTPAYKGNREAARTAVLQNGGTEEMTASQFAEKWDEKIGTTATPGFQGVQTGTELDVVPYADVMKLYEPAAQNAFFSRVENDPQGAMALLDTPAFSRIDEKTKTSWRAAARTAFQNADENAKIDRVLATANQNTEVWNAFVNGQLNPAQVSQMESTGRITPELANYMRVQQSKSIPNRTVAEMNDKYADMFDRYNELGITKRKGRMIGSGTLEDYVTFQRDVIQAAAQGYITRDQANSFLKNISQPLAKAVEDPGNPGWFTPDPNEAGYEMIDRWLQISNLNDDKQVKAEILRRFVLNMEQAQNEGKELPPAWAANQAITSYRQNQFPILQMVESQPNAIMPKDGGMALIMPGPSAAKPQAKVDAGVRLMQDASGRFALVSPDRKVMRTLSAQEAEQYRQQGY